MTTSASISAAQLIRLRDELGASTEQMVHAALALWLGPRDPYGAEALAVCARLWNQRQQQRRAA